jgi:flagellar basal body P-ring formation protein FlgA
MARGKPVPDNGSPLPSQLPLWCLPACAASDGPFLAWQVESRSGLKERPMVLPALMHGLLGAGALLAPAVLQSQVEAFAGQAALVDPRLLLPACARPEFGWGPGGRSVMVHCAMPEWRVFVPVGGGGAAAAVKPPSPSPTRVAASPPAIPAIRRGDRVSLEVGGDGFVIAMDVVADTDSKDGRVALRPVAGGRRLNGIIDADGHVRLHGLNNMVNGR